MQICRSALTVLFLFGALLHAQNTQMTLTDCVNYGLSYHPDIKVALLQRQDADWQVRESKGGALPQLSAGVNYQYFLKKPALPVAALGLGGPNTPPDAKLSFVLGHSTSANATLSQLFFSNSYRIAVRVADFYRQYVAEGEQVARKKVKDQVVAAFLPALLISDNLTILDKNITNLETLLKETTAIQKAGFAEQLDVDRLELALTTIRSERGNLARQRTTVVDALKFAMGYPVDQQLELKDNVQQLVSTYSSLDLTQMVEPTQRPEFRQISKARDLSLLNQKLHEKTWLPTVAGFVNYQAGLQGNNFFDPFFVPQSVIGLSANFNLYDGGTEKARRQRAIIQTQTIEVQRGMLENAFKLEWEATKVQYANAQERIKNQQKNLDLAQRIYDTTQKKYKAGIGSSFEVVSAEQGLYTAQQALMQAQFDLLTAYTAAQKAMGQ
jgi:outer membrane protein